MAKYIDLRSNYNDEIFNEIGQAIREDKLVVFPTETVYGIGANGLSSLAVKKIYNAKGRNSDNPLILHISSFDMLNKIVKDISFVEKKLINAFFPRSFYYYLK